MTVYTNLLAMTANIPFGARADAFWLHTAITLAIALLTIIIFRAKKWF
jgi:Mg2+ and Co2+ transporter CorA